MDYTDEEIQDAVEALVLSSINTPYGALGERKIPSVFSQIQEAAAGVFLLHFNAPFYVAYLGARRLLELVSNQASLANEALQAIVDTGRITHPVEDLTPLANAAAALGELSTTISERTQGFQNIDVVPAWRRYAQNIDAFIAANGRNIKRGGSIVQTPEQARKKLPALLSALRENHALIVERAGFLASALEDFGALNLPAISASGVLSRARAKLDARYDELLTLSEEGRLQILRELALDLLAQKAVVKKYGAVQKPTPYHQATGAASAFSDATHFASPASITATAGPYRIIEGSNQLNIVLDGSTVVNYTMPFSFVAELTGIAVGPFIIDSTNDEVSLQVGNPPTTVVIPLTQGTRTSAQIASQLHSGLASYGVTASTAFFPEKLDTFMSSTHLGLGTIRYTVLGGSLLGLNIKVGDEVDILSGSNMGVTRFVSAVDPNGMHFTTVGPGSGASEASVHVRVGPPGRVIKITDTDALSSIAQRRKIRFVSDDGGKHDYAARTLGFGAEFYAQSAPTLARELRDAINASLAAPRAAVTLTPIVTCRGRTDVANPVLVRVYKGTGTANVDGSVPNQMTLSSIVLVDGEMPAVGQALVLRTGVNHGKLGLISSVNAGVVVVSISGSVTSASAIEFDTGIVAGHDYGWILEITSGPNTGEYVIVEPGGAVPFDIELRTAPPITKFGDQPLRFDVRICRESLVLSSVSPTVSSEIQVDGSGAGLLFSSLPAVSIGSTQYLSLTEIPKSLLLNDILEVYETQYNEPSRSFSVVGIDRELGIIQISEPVESSFLFDFGDGVSPTPFVRLRIGEVANYDGFSAKLKNWLVRPENQDGFFTNLGRLVNPLLVNRNPTAASVNDAERELQKLVSYLTAVGAVSYGAAGSGASTATEADTLESVLSGYTVSPVEPVDVLLKSYRERGADRAIDILLQGRFSTFFGLSLNEVSYSGHFQEAVRVLVREDLPVRKYNRTDFSQERLLSAHKDTDYEFDVSDADTDLPPDPTPVSD